MKADFYLSKYKDCARGPGGRALAAVLLPACAAYYPPTTALRTRGARERASRAEHRPPNTYHGSVSGFLVWWHRGMDARLLRRSSLGRLVRGAALVVKEVAVGPAGKGPRHRLVALLDKGVLDLAEACRSARVSGTRTDPWYSAVEAGGVRERQRERAVRGQRAAVLSSSAAAAAASAAAAATRLEMASSPLAHCRGGWVVCCGPHLLILVVAVRVVAHGDEAHIQANDRQEDERNLLPLVGLSCARKTIVRHRN